MTRRNGFTLIELLVVVAIIALLTYNIFVTAVNTTMGNLRLTLEELLDHSFDEKGQVGA